MPLFQNSSITIVLHYGIEVNRQIIQNCGEKFVEYAY